MGRFKPGQSGNPSGKPRGAKDKRTELRALLKPHAEALVQKVVEMALQGDKAALRLCLERLVAPIRSKDEPVCIPGMKGTLSERAAKVTDGMAQGRITPHEGATILGALAAQAKIIESDELEKRIAKLEERNT
jgi:hypothetical protein